MWCIHFATITTLTVPNRKDDIITISIFRFFGRNERASYLSTFPSLQRCSSPVHWMFASVHAIYSVLIRICTQQMRTNNNWNGYEKLGEQSNGTEKKNHKRIHLSNYRDIHKIYMASIFSCLGFFWLFFLVYLFFVLPSVFIVCCVLGTKAYEIDIIIHTTSKTQLNSYVVQINLIRNAFINNNFWLSSFCRYAHRSSSIFF